MHLSLAKEHRDFFKKHSQIEFSALLSPAQVCDFANAVDEVVLKQQNEKNSFRDLGRDLWRDHPAIKKTTLKKDFAEIVAGLTGLHEIRIGYDQSIDTAKEPVLSTGMTSLQQTSCIKPIIMGLLIRLSEGSQPDSGMLPCPCPSSPGDGVFFSSQLLVSWDPLLALKNQRFFLIAYAGAHPIYILEKRDPCTHALKQHGYVFGDALKTDTHPVLFTE